MKLSKNNPALAKKRILIGVGIAVLLLFLLLFIGKGCGDTAPISEDAPTVYVDCILDALAQEYESPSDATFDNVWLIEEQNYLDFRGEIETAKGSIKILAATYRIEKDAILLEEIQKINVEVNSILQAKGLQLLSDKCQ